MGCKLRLWLANRCGVAAACAAAWCIYARACWQEPLDHPNPPKVPLCGTTSAFCELWSVAASVAVFTRSQVWPCSTPTVADTKWEKELLNKTLEPINARKQRYSSTSLGIQRLRASTQSQTRNWWKCEEKRWETGWGQRGGQKTGVNRGETKGKEAAWCQTVGEGHDDECPLLMTPTSVQLLCTLCWGRSSKPSGNVWVSPVLVPKTFLVDFWAYHVLVFSHYNPPQNTWETEDPTPAAPLVPCANITSIWNSPFLKHSPHSCTLGRFFIFSLSSVLNSTAIYCVKTPLVPMFPPSLTRSHPVRMYTGP